MKADIVPWRPWRPWSVRALQVPFFHCSAKFWAQRGVGGLEGGAEQWASWRRPGETGWGLSPTHGETYEYNNLMDALQTLVKDGKVEWGALYAMIQEPEELADHRALPHGFGSQHGGGGFDEWSM
jgi:hypothetical protein